MSHFWHWFYHWSASGYGTPQNQFHRSHFYFLSSPRGYRISCHRFVLSRDALSRYVSCPFLEYYITICTVFFFSKNFAISVVISCIQYRYFSFSIRDDTGYVSIFSGSRGKYWFFSCCSRTFDSCESILALSAILDEKIHSTDTDSLAPHYRLYCFYDNGGTS